MIVYTIKRCISGMVVLFIVSVITFFILSVIPGDTPLMRLGTEATPELVEQLRESMGLNLPWYERYVHWIGDFLRGDWGESLCFWGRCDCFNFTTTACDLNPAALSLTIAIPVAVVMGVVSPFIKTAGLIMLARTLMQIGEAVPQFWLALIFLVIFAGKFGWFPVAGYVSIEEGFLRSLHSLLLPAIVLIHRIHRHFNPDCPQFDAYRFATRFYATPKVNGLPKKIALLNTLSGVQ